jgi:hypothetical protein
MYVYMYKVLHNIWNIDLILRLQKFNAMNKILPWTISKKKEKNKKQKTFDTIKIYNNHFRSKINRFT